MNECAHPSHPIPSLCLCRRRRGPQFPHHHGDTPIAATILASLYGAAVALVMAASLLLRLSLWRAEYIDAWNRSAMAAPTMHAYWALSKLPIATANAGSPRTGCGAFTSPIASPIGGQRPAPTRSRSYLHSLRISFTTISTNRWPSARAQ
jgi:hypothetical protein